MTNTMIPNTFNRVALCESLRARAGLPSISGNVDPGMLTYKPGLAREFRDATLLQAIGHCLELEGAYADPSPRIRAAAAFTSANVAGLFSDVAGASFHDGHAGEIDTTLGWTNERDIDTFQIQERTVLYGDAAMQPLGRGGQAKDADLHASGPEHYRAVRFARKFGIDDQDLIDDRLNALTDPARLIGAAAASLRPDLVYTIILANPLLSDGIALFHASRGNLGSSALSASTLEAAIATMSNQADLDGRPLRLRPKWLITSPGLKMTAAALLKTLDLPANERIELRSEPRLGVAGVTDPLTGTLYAGSATFWMLIAPGPSIEIGFVRGQRQARVRVYPDPGIGRWGMLFDWNLDIGAKALTWQSLHVGNV